MATKLSEVDWFEWNSTKCTQYGMHVLGQPSIISAAERVSNEEIPGRSGALTLLEGDNIFDDITLAVTCVIDSPYETAEGESVSRIAKICGWLRGNGEIKFANQPDGYYKGRMSSQISFDKIVSGDPHMAFQVQFRCQPFFYLDSGETAITIPVADSPKQLTNPGNIPSQPVIKLTGTGEGTIMAGNSTMLINSFEDIEYLMLDCEAKIAYTGIPGDTSDPLKLLGTRVTGEWLTIPVGTSFFTLTGNITSAIVTPRWRCV